ncbi:unnamed protein product, partial [Brenthis ino]
MAKFQINTKSRDYLRDKEAFLKELKQFNESKNIPYKIPVVNGVDIDLYLLYSLVIQKGGLSKVNQNDTWESFLRQLRLPHPCVNGSTLLRRIYGTYLEKYERAKGPPGRDDDNDMDDDPRRGSRSGMPRISFGSGTYISASGEQLRTGNRVAGPSERLTLSLLSPMPNEQDFAVNVCTVLAADHSNRLPLSTTPHILDFLLAHAGVYNHSSLRDTIGRSYYEARGRYPHEFWQLRAGGGGAKELADETKFMQPGLEQPELMVQALAAHNTLTDCLMQGDESEDLMDKILEDDILEDWVTEPSEEDQLFAPELSGGASCVYTQRVLQIASIVRSLSFHEENIQYLARNTTLIRFLLLCANCWVGTLRQSGLDTLGNVSTELIIKDPATCLISRHVLSTIQSALVSPDRARVLAALELLNKLAQNEANEDALLKALDPKVYSDVCALLTLRDIMALVSALECVYALTALGDRACEAAARAPGLLHTLVSLVTVEAQSYGPRACILMRVVETVSGPAALAAPQDERPQPQPQELLDTTNECLSALRNLDIDVSSWDVIIIYMISQKLDPQSRKEWELYIGDVSQELPKLSQFNDFLEHRYRALEFIDPKMNKKYTRNNDIKALHVSNAISCGYCSGDHKLYNCKKFANEDVHSRRNFVQLKRLCFNCLGLNHSVYSCRQSTRCRICKRKHHSLLHTTEPSKSDEEIKAVKSVREVSSTSSQSETDNVISCHSNIFSQVLLATAMVKIKARKGNFILFRSLLDQGSQASFITEAAVQMLGLRKIPNRSIISGIGGEEESKLSSKAMVIVNIQSRTNPNFIITVKAHVLSKLTALLPEKNVTVEMITTLSSTELADPSFNIPNKIDLLLGADVYGQILLEGIVKGPPGTPIAQNTQFGWILSGQPQQSQPTKVVESQASPSATPAPMTPLQQSHLQQRTAQENEHFALAWLRATYEPLPGGDNSASDAADLHRAYAQCCAKLARKGVIAAAHFPRLVRTVFGGTVGPNTITNAAGETQHVYIGIRAKNLSNRTNPPVGPSSPILKAQLTNKPTVVETKPVVTQPQAQAPPPHPHLAQALEPGAGNNTSLIKHLLAHKVSPPHVQVAQRQQNQQRVGTAGTVVVQQNPTTNMEVDPEALIKCTTIIPGGVSNATGEKLIINANEEVVVPKEEPVQIQIDEQAQLTIKTAQNKMLADLLEKKSNPPVQVVQMGQQINAPTIQITETGQIVQVKTENNPLIQIAPENVPSAPFFQIKNEQGQLIQIKNDQGQIIQLKSDQLQGVIQLKSDQGQMVHIKNDQVIQPSVIQSVKAEKDQIVETVVTDHSYTEPPSKKAKVEEKSESNAPKESVSKTAANLYAALAASALEDEDDLLPPKQETVEVIPPSVLVAGASENSSVIIQEPILQVQQPTLQVQQSIQVQQPTIQVQASSLQVQQPTLQVQQPMLQVQPMDVQNIIASQAGQIILQEKPVTSQTTQFVQQPMQIIATPSTSQGLSYIAQNIPGNMMQKTIIIVQGPTGGGPLTLTVNNPAGLDEATLNSLIAQATEAITQQQIIQNSGVIQSTQRVIVSQPTLVSTSQPIAVVKTTITQNAPQITPSQQPIITTQPQPHKAQIMNQPQTQQIVVTQKQPPALISTSSTNQIVTNQIVTSNQQIIQGNQQLLQGNQQIIAVSNNQQIIVNAPMKQGVHRIVQQPQRSQVTTVPVTSASMTMDSKPSAIQSAVKPAQPVMRQVITRQPVMMGNTKIGDKEVFVSQSVAEKPATPKKIETPPPQPLPPGADDTPWICHWRGCGKTFSNASEVFSHAARAHCPRGAGAEAACQWADCDRVPRRTFALLNHLTDKHCTPHALKALYNSRRHMAAEAEASKPVSLGYPPNAALAALNKHAADMFNPRELMHRADVSRTPDQMDENEGPVTKSIRLTAALILRNIVIYSNTGRRILRSYEAHLASIALSNVEASRTIAQVLYDMSNI